MFAAKRPESFLQMRDALAIRGICGSGCFLHWLGLKRLHIARQEMRVPRFFGPGLSRKNFCERGLALHQVLQAGLHSAEVVEWMHAFGAGAEFAGSLRTAQQ